MDVQYFLNVLKKRKWLIIIPMLLTAMATYYFINKQPKLYDAKASLTTGIVEITGYNRLENSPFLQKMQIEISFANLIKFITTNKTLRFLSYEMLSHDILADSTSTDPPFTKVLSSQVAEFTPEELQALAYVLKSKVDTLDTSLAETDDILYRKVAKIYGYDVESLAKDKFSVKRDGETDALQLKYVDGTPKACSYAVNKFAEILRGYHEKEQKKGDIETYNNYYSLAERRKNNLRKLEKELENYKSGKGIVDIDIQSEGTVNQILELESELEQASRDVKSNKAIINRLDSYLNDNDIFKVDTKSKSVMSSKSVVTLRERIAKLTDQYIDGGRTDKNLERQISLTQDVLSQQIKKLTNEKIKDTPGMVEQGEKVLSDRIQTEMDLTLALESQKSIKFELDRLKGRRDGYVTDEAYTKNLESRIEIANKEYLATLDRVSETNFKTISAVHRLELLDWADIPENPIPDNKYLLSSFAGLVTGSLAMVLLFLLSLFDLSLNTPNQFQKFTNLNLLGTLNKIKDSNLDLKQLFATFTNNKNLENFKESLRKLRYMFEESGGTTFLFTSTKDGEGKTFMILTLAYALTLKDKKILIIDTNFKNNTLTRMSNETINDNLLHTRLIGENNLAEQFEAKRMATMFNLDNVDIIGNRGTSHSPSEFFAGRDFQNFINDLAESYDYIFLEGASLNKYSDTRELVGFADKIVAVFSAESEIKDADKDSIDYLLSKNDKFMGSILNKIDVKNLN